MWNEAGPKKTRRICFTRREDRGKSSRVKFLVDEFIDGKVAVIDGGERF